MSGIKPTEAHRMVCFQGKEKRMRTYPLAGDTDNDASYDQDEPEEMAVEQSSQVPVTPSVHQTTLSSFRINRVRGRRHRQDRRQEGQTVQEPPAVLRQDAGRRVQPARAH